MASEKQMTSQAVFICGERIYLRALQPKDATAEYLRWLNDPEVLRYRGPKVFPTTQASLERFIEQVSDTGDLVLAICEARRDRHIGNIALNTILWHHRSAELSIMIGDRPSWGKGYGKESIVLLTRHAFANMGLNRIWAESPNPHFNATVKQLGWRSEGRKREAFLLDGRFVDIECFAILAAEYFASVTSTSEGGGSVLDHTKKFPPSPPAHK